MKQHAGSLLQVIYLNLVEFFEHLIKREVPPKEQFLPRDTHHAVAHAFEAEHDVALDLVLGLVERPCTDRLIGQFVDVEITEALPNSLRGRLLSPAPGERGLGANASGGHSNVTAGAASVDGAMVCVAGADAVVPSPPAYR